MTINVKENPVVQVQKNGNFTQNGIVNLTTGIKAKILPVSASLIDEVTSRIKNPKIPVVYNESKERNEPNPLDPQYVEDLEAATKARGQAAMDAMVMFGLELVDEIPSDTTWVKKLRYLGIEFDVDDAFEREFAYKKYIACASDDLKKIAQKAGITQEAIVEASKKF